MAGQCATQCSRAMFRVGQALLVIGIVCIIVSATTTYWVVRPEVNLSQLEPNQTVVVNYGIFKACKQPSSGSGRGNRDKCGSLWDNLNLINGSTVRYVQFLVVVSAVLYIISVVVEIVQILPIKKFRNFLAQNRIAEAFTGIAAVLILQGMVVFAGEVKNKAERMKGQDEEQTGWSFILCLMGLITTVFSLVLTVMFRDLPLPHAHAKGGSWVKNM